MAQPKIGHDKLRERALGVEDDILEKAVFIEFVQKDGKIISFAWFNRSEIAEKVFDYIKKLKGDNRNRGLTVIEDQNRFQLDHRNRIAKSGKERMLIEVDP